MLIGNCPLRAFAAEEMIRFFAIYEAGGIKICFGDEFPALAGTDKAASLRAKETIHAHQNASGIASRDEAASFFDADIQNVLQNGIGNIRLGAGKIREKAEIHGIRNHLCGKRHRSGLPHHHFIILRKLLGGITQSFIFTKKENFHTNLHT